MSTISEMELRHFTDRELIEEVFRRGIHLEMHPHMVVYGPTTVEYRDRPRNARAKSRSGQGSSTGA